MNREAVLLFSIPLICTSSAVWAVKLATFNIQVFGQRKAHNEAVMGILAKIINEFDVVVIQEIRDRKGTAFPKLLEKVNHLARGNRGEYQGITGPRKGKGISKEQIGVIYRPGIVESISEIPTHRNAELFERPPDCFVLSLQDGLTFALLAAHIDPDVVANELDALHDVADECLGLSNTTELIILGDMNADCRYLPDKAKRQLRLRKDGSFKWRVSDDADTTVGTNECAYDRVITKGSEVERRVSDGHVFDFQKEYGLTSASAKRVSDHHPVWVNIT